ncbi:MAG: LruC domain-containing protein [Bacteroidales bacterium]
MKKFIKLFAIAACLAAVVSCVKDNTGNGEEPTEPKKLTDLVIPAGFDWKTIDDIQCNFASVSYATRVSLFYTSDCLDNTQIADLYITPEYKNFKISVSKALTQIYMKYQQQGGEYKIIPVPLANPLNIVVPSDSKKLDNVSNLTKGFAGSTNNSMIRVRGTMFFEDMYPNLGDYDFNDYAFTYDHIATINSGNISSMELYFQVLCIGGTLPYELYVRLKGVKTSDVTDVQVFVQKGELLSVRKVDATNPNDDCILSVTGIPEKVKSQKPKESKLYNTEKGQINKKLVIQTPTVIITLKSGVKYTGGDMYDMFLGGEIKDITGTSYREIHDKDNSSSWLIKNVNEKVDSYVDSKGFVWAIKVAPDDRYLNYGIPYPYEYVGILDAYPGFANWIITKGQDQSWVKSMNTEKVAILK